MIQVISHGRRYVIKCKICGAVFTYSRTDTSCAFGDRWVQCPDCGEAMKATGKMYCESENGQSEPPKEEEDEGR